MTILSDEEWHLALMQACTGLTAGANALRADRAALRAKLAERDRLLADLERAAGRVVAYYRDCKLRGKPMSSMPNFVNALGDVLGEPRPALEGGPR